MSGLVITMAGVDITSHVSEDPNILEVDLQLAQGSGTGNGTSTRAATFTFLTDLGPAATAVGAGTHISTPQLVRYGEVTVSQGGVMIYGGFATQFEDDTDKTRIYTKVTCVDYWQILDRTIISTETLTAMSDLAIIKYVLTTYAPWVDLSALPTTPGYTFPNLNVRSKSVQWALQKVVDTTGMMIYITPDKKVHYESPTKAPDAPFSLSTAPDFHSSYPYQVADNGFTIDDDSAVNRVYFYGGNRPSNDFTQDISTQANGTNTTFMLAYYPREASDGKVHVYVNSVEQVVGFAISNDNKPQNVLKSQGGLADVLLNSDAHTLLFDTPPASGALVQAKYRYEFPLLVTVINQQSVTFYGRYIDAIITDNTVLDTTTAVQRCNALLFYQAFGLQSLEVYCWQPGLLPGQVLHVYHSIRGINNNYLVQEVKYVPLGAGNYYYDVTVGSWNWNAVDVMMQLAQAATPDNTNTEQADITVDARQLVENKHLHEVWSVAGTWATGAFYADTPAQNDGHDAYCGFASVTS